MENWKTIAGVFVGSVVVVVLMAFGLSKMSGSNGSGTKADEKVLTDGARFIKENGDTKVTVVEFSDVQCPACKIAEPVADELKQTKGVKYIYRQYPLYTIHKNALNGAHAAEAARLMGKGFEMISLLFEKQTDWADLGNPETTYIGYAKSLGLDEKDFKTKYESDEVVKLVEGDIAVGDNLKLSGTPTFFVDGEQTAVQDVVTKVKEKL